jgi:hypothetical protein
MWQQFSGRRACRQVVWILASACCILAAADVAKATVVIINPPPPTSPPVENNGPATYSAGAGGYTTPISSGPTVATSDSGFSISGDTSLTINNPYSGPTDLTVQLEGELSLTVNTAGYYYIGMGTGIFIGTSGAASGDPTAYEAPPSSYADLLENNSLVPGSLVMPTLSSTASESFGSPVNATLPGYEGSGFSNAFYLQPANDYTLQWFTDVTFTNVQAGENLYMVLPGQGSLDPAPEPASFAVWGLGATLIGGFARWRHKRRKSTTIV